jgi:hypothetical protein
MVEASGSLVDRGGGLPAILGTQLKDRGSKADEHNGHVPRDWWHERDDGGKTEGVAVRHKAN